MAAAYVDWYQGARLQTHGTPPDLFAQLHAQYRFTLDGAADSGNALLPRASTLEHPLPWTGERVFCNPPWSDILPFIDLAVQAEFSCLLVPARTNARWFHLALAFGVVPEFFLGRPRFAGNKNNSPVDCLLLLFGAA